MLNSNKIESRGKFPSILYIRCQNEFQCNYFIEIEIAMSGRCEKLPFTFENVWMLFKTQTQRLFHPSAPTTPVHFSVIWKLYCHVVYTASRQKDQTVYIYHVTKLKQIMKYFPSKQRVLVLRHEDGGSVVWLLLLCCWVVVFIYLFNSSWNEGGCTAPGLGNLF